VRGRVKTRILGKSNVFRITKSDRGELTRLDVEIATTSHRTTSTYAVGSSRERRFQLELWLVLLRASRRENLTTAFPRPRILSRFLLTGSPSRALDTAELQSTLPPGPPHKTPVFIPLSTSTIWQKRSASHHVPRLLFRARTGMRRLSRLAFQGEINVDQAHRGYDVTVDETGKTWYNPF